MASRSSVKVVDKGWRAIVADINVFSKSDVYIGINEGNFPARVGEDGSTESLTMAQIGAVHEFGSTDGNIPPRPWLRSAIDSQRRQIAEAITNAYDEIVHRVRNVQVILNRLGLLGVNIVQTYMRVTGPAVWLALSPLTVEAKGSDVPLADTGQLIGSITYVVKHKNKTIDKSKPLTTKSAATGAKKAKSRAQKLTKRRRKARRFATKARQSEAVKQIVADRAERKRVRKAAKRARLKNTRVAQRERKKAKASLKRQKQSALLIARKQSARDRKAAIRARRRTRIKEHRTALRYRKKDRQTLKRIRTKQRKTAHKIRLKSNAKFRQLDAALKKL